MKVLIIRFSSIGDIVLTTPVLRCLKQQLPGVSVHYLTKSSFHPVLEANPYIDRMHFLQEDWNQMIDGLKQEQFDYVIDLHHNIRTARVKKALGVRSYSFPKLNVRKWLYVNVKMNLMPDKSIVERYFEAVQPLGVRNDTKGLDYFIPTADEIGQNDIPMSHWGGYLGYVIGGSYHTKQLPVNRWQELCRMSPIPVILLGGPEDRESAAEIASIDPIKIYNSCGKFSLNESADLVRRSKLVISNDTGLMHIAAAFKKPVISLWGNTTPDMGMFPYYGYNNINNRIAPESLLVEHQHLGCRPCSKIGYNKCPRKHFRCMNDLDFKKVEIFIKKYI